MNIPIIIGLSIVAALGGQPLSAQEGEGPQPLRFGVEFIGSSPRQDFQAATDKAGLGLGVFAENDLGSGNLIQTRFDYIRYPQTNHPGGGLSPYTPPDPLSLSLASATLAVDLRHHLASPGLEPLFLQVGILAVSYELESSTAPVPNPEQDNPNPGIGRTKDKLPFKLGFDLGLGYNLTPAWAITLRYTSMTADSTDFATLDALLSYRF